MAERVPRAEVPGTGCRSSGEFSEVKQRMDSEV